MSIKDILNEETGRLFRARIVQEGDAYGRDMCLVHEKSEALIEFYDATYDFETSPEGEVLGQFVGRYYIDTLVGRDRIGSDSIFTGDTGLNLDGGVDVWSIDKHGIAEVEIFLLDEGFISELSSPIALEKLAKREDNSPQMG